MRTNLIYDILTYLVIGVAVFVTIKKVFENSFKKKDPSSCSDGCGGCTSKCDLKDLAQENTTNSFQH